MGLRAKGGPPGHPLKRTLVFCSPGKWPLRCSQALPWRYAMLRWLTAMGTALSLFALITSVSNTRFRTHHAKSSWWPVALKANNQFDNWT